MSDWRGAAEAFGKAAAKGAYDAGKSTVQGLGDLAKGGWAIATDPAAREKAGATAKQIARHASDYYGSVKADPAKALRDAKDGANALYTKFDDARKEAAKQGKSPEFWGNAAGHAGAEVGMLLVPVGAVTKAGKLARGARAAEEAGELTKATKVASAAERASAVEKAAPELSVAAQGCPLKKLASYEAKLASGLTPVMAARREKALAFMIEDMGKTPDEAESLVRGLDLTQPVEVVEIPPPDTATQWVRIGHEVPGEWFNPDPAQTPDMLGLNGDPERRVMREFKVPVTNPKLKALKSIAAPVVDNWTDKANQLVTGGGGTQLTVPRAVTEQIVKATHGVH